MQQSKSSLPARPQRLTFWRQNSAPRRVIQHRQLSPGTPCALCSGRAAPLLGNREACPGLPCSGEPPDAGASAHPARPRRPGAAEGMNAREGALSPGAAGAARPHVSEGAVSLGHPEDSLQGRHSFPASEAFVEGQPFSRFSFSPLAWSEPHGDTRDGKQAGRRPQTRQGCADSEGQTRASAHPANIDTAGPGRGVEEGATAVLPTGDRRFPLGFNPILQQPKLQ